MGAPCFFVKQKDKLRLCMDYRGLNKQTVKDRNPIPLISEMLRTLSSGNIFTTLDLRGAYNLLRIKEGDEPKTAFITKYGQFEFLVMPFGLANAPAQFQRMMNSLFRHMIILGLYYFSKWDFHGSVLRSLLYKIGRLPKKNKKPRLGSLKDAFAQPGFLAHPNDEQPFILETDASDFAISGVLHQHDQSNTLRPVAFYSRQMNNAERNYDIYDKELLAVVKSFKHWRHLLQGGLHPVTVLCDHKNLEYFMSTKKLTRRQARWSLELSEYTFTITHRPGKLNGRADSLSRREDYFLDGDQSNFQRIIDPENVWISKLQWRISIFTYWFTVLSWIRTHAPLPIRPVPPVALPFERWGIDFYGPMVETKKWQLMGWFERMHAMLGTRANNLVADKRDRWDEYLPQVLLAIRTRPHSVTGLLAILPTLWHTPSTPQRRNTPQEAVYAFGRN
ncbi:hypothetical protein BASA83_003661 [Batrachochytrium salamandrivorans]|nr:hypothetical protein BASA83_003661 [Batrachochytrium salamandrivorans]